MIQVQRGSECINETIQTLRQCGHAELNWNEKDIYAQQCKQQKIRLLSQLNPEWYHRSEHQFLDNFSLLYRVAEIL